MTPSSDWRSGLRRFFEAQRPPPPPRPPPPSAPPAPVPEWLDVEGAAARARVSKQTVYRALRGGALAGTKPSGPGGHWRVSPAAVDGWIGAGRRQGPRPTTAEIGRPPVNPDHTWNP
jgi:excisionase family DNA binding protein